jgi:hypothetical protein
MLVGSGCRSEMAAVRGAFVLRRRRHATRLSAGGATAVQRKEARVGTKGGGGEGTAAIVFDDDGEPPVRQHVRHLLPVAVQRSNALCRTAETSAAAVRRNGRTSEAPAVRGALVLRRLRLVLRRQWHTWLAGAAADVLPWAVSVQRVQRLPDRPWEQV